MSGVEESIAEVLRVGEGAAHSREKAPIAPRHGVCRVVARIHDGDHQGLSKRPGRDGREQSEEGIAFVVDRYREHVAMPRTDVCGERCLALGMSSEIAFDYVIRPVPGGATQCSPARIGRRATTCASASSSRAWRSSIWDSGKYSRANSTKRSACRDSERVICR